MRLHRHSHSLGEIVVTNGYGYDCPPERSCWYEGDPSERTWPLPMWERLRLAAAHEPEASSSPDGYRPATCVVCGDPMVGMWHLWVSGKLPDGRALVKEIHMCARCAADVYGAPEQDVLHIRTGRIIHGDA